MDAVSKPQTNRRRKMQTRLVWLMLLVACAMCALSSFGLAGNQLAEAGYHHKGRVHINVWRGPSKGYGKHKFAPWGYYAKLPADDYPKHHHY